MVSGSVQTIVSEISKMLRRQYCNVAAIKWFLQAAGYSVTECEEGLMVGPSGETSLLARVEP